MPELAVGTTTELTGHTALVTGASSGLGERFARVLAAAGAKLVIAARRHDRLQALADELTAEGADVVCRPLDVMALETLPSFFDELAAADSLPDILVNNAGTTKFMNHDNLEGLDKADFEQIYALNLIAPYQMAKHARPHLEKSDAPSVVNISSVAGVRGVGSSIAYAASKGALNSMTLALARTLGHNKIRVNAVCPGFVGTNWFRNAFGDDGFNMIVEAQKNITPMNQVAGPEDITGPILFFASRMSGHVTGQLLVVDGGMLLGMPFNAN